MDYARVIAESHFHGVSIPVYMQGGLLRYLKHGAMPGKFLRAVLENDLKEAVHQADDTNIEILPVYVNFLYNQAPSPAWGSKKKVAAWVASFQRKPADDNIPF